ncbi:hypothetical protein [Phenylobacterium soli]|uniref:Uncharacterized protein n=1 Tax=Phenylobacterium soli TaxID=2170551 RepID=A0A328AK52_9CAUL|nr:hypothetical protein [Phenylobacterium soli]RAK54979.1 hypothetical protein DJ017_10790 [Phenylobacterium soli]
MSAFQAYGGAYEHDGRSFRWRCYATARVYEVREGDPALPAPRGKKWIRKSPFRGEPEFSWLIDEAIEDFSHILLQMEPPQPQVVDA